MHRRQFLQVLTATAAVSALPLAAGAQPSAAPSMAGRALLEEHGTVLSRIAWDGRVQWTAGGRGDRPGQLESAAEAVVDSRGQVWVADRGNGRVQVFSASGVVLHVITEAAGKPLTLPSGIAAGRFVAVADPGNHRVLLFDLNARFVASIGRLDGDPTFNYPRDVAWDPAGRLHIMQAGDARVDVFGPQGHERSYGGLDVMDRPFALSIDEAGTSWVTDRVAGKLLGFDASGKLTRTAALPGR